MELEGDSDLLEIVSTGVASGSLTRGLHGRQKKTDEDGDDRDHHQKLDEREATLPRGTTADCVDGPRANDVHENQPPPRRAFKGCVTKKSESETMTDEEQRMDATIKSKPGQGVAGIHHTN
jgi:hypothetical protein